MFTVRVINADYMADRKIENADSAWDLFYEKCKKYINDQTSVKIQLYKGTRLKISVKVNAKGVY